MNYRLVGVVLLAALGGCAHQLYFTDLDSGATGHTTITTSPGHPSGEISLVLGGKTYTGRWLYMSGGGSLSLATATVTSGRHVAYGSGTLVGIPTRGNGSIVLSAPGGAVIRCIFNYSEWSSSGAGGCRGQDGVTYDLQIS